MSCMGKDANSVFISRWYSSFAKLFAFPRAARISDKFCRAFTQHGFHGYFNVYGEDQAEEWVVDGLPQGSFPLLPIIADFSIAGYKLAGSF